MSEGKVKEQPTLNEMQIGKRSYFESFYVICSRSWTEGLRHIEEPAPSKQGPEAEAEGRQDRGIARERGGRRVLCLEAVGKSQKA